MGRDGHEAQRLEGKSDRNPSAPGSGWYVDNQGRLRRWSGTPDPFRTHAARRKRWRDARICEFYRKRYGVDGKKKARRRESGPSS